jgi:iron complex outermembrane receptor protein
MKKQPKTIWNAIAACVTVIALQGITLADSLSGRVVDPQGNVVVNARLRLYDRDSGALRQATSASDGQYRFADIAEGDYLMEVDAATAFLSGSFELSVAGDLTENLALSISSVNVEVLVTASSTPQTLQSVAKAIDVVDAEEIALRNELSIAESLRNLPGTRVRTLGGPGSFTTIQTRGLRSQDTAVLIDGMRFRDAAGTQGDASGFLQTMATVDTESIEVLRGSGSSLYGSNAMGGVINITSQSGGGGTHGDFRSEGGGLGMIRSVASIGGGTSQDRFTYSGAISHLNLTKGVRDGNPYRNTSPQGSATYNFTPSTSLTGRLWWASDYQASQESPAFPAAVAANFPASGPIPAIALPTSQLELFEQGLAYDAGNATFVPSQMDRDGRRISSFLNTSVSFQQQIGARGSYRVTYQLVDTHRDFIDGPARGGSFEPSGGDTLFRADGRIDTLQARADYQAGDYNLINVGYELENEEYLNFTTDTSRTPTANSNSKITQLSHSFFAQDQIRLMDGRLQVTVGGRVQSFNVDDPSFSAPTNPYTGIPFSSPSAYTADGSIAYFFADSQTKLRGHVGNSYRTPSAFERFGSSFSSFSSSFSFWGDPGLTPERSIAVDAGIDQWLFGSKVQLGATAFYTNLQETIIFDFANFPAATDPFGRFGGYRNTGGGIARGVEFSFRASPFASSNLQMSYTHTNSDSRTPTIGSDFHKVLGVSDHMFSLTASQWIANRVNLTFDFFAGTEYTMSPFGVGGRPLVFDGPLKGDLMLRYDLPVSGDKTMELYAKIENVFNTRRYENGFFGPGAWAIGGFRFRY